MLLALFNYVTPKYKTFAFTTTPFLNICKIEKSWNPKLLSCKAKYLIYKKKDNR